MSRKILAKDSGVSERYLAQLESGAGNISILLLRQVARAMDLPITEFLGDRAPLTVRSEEHTSELQSLMRISYAVFCLKKKTHKTQHKYTNKKYNQHTTETAR